MEKENLSPSEMSDILNMQSGMMGICGYSDDRDVTKAEIEGDHKAILAHEMLTYQIAKYIGAYVTAMGGLTAWCSPPVSVRTSRIFAMVSAVTSNIWALKLTACSTMR